MGDPIEKMVRAHGVEWDRWKISWEPCAPGAHWRVMRDDEEVESGLLMADAEIRRDHLRKQAAMRAAVLALKSEFQDPVVRNALQFVADAKGQTP